MSWTRVKEYFSPQNVVEAFEALLYLELGNQKDVTHGICFLGEYYFSRHYSLKPSIPWDSLVTKLQLLLHQPFLPQCNKIIEMY